MDLFLLTGFDSARATFKTISGSGSMNPDENDIYCNCDSDKPGFFMFFMLLVKLFIFIFAVRKSWECSKGLPNYQRIFYSLMAGIFGTLYTILYLIFGSGAC